MVVYNRGSRKWRFMNKALMNLYLHIKRALKPVFMLGGKKDRVGVGTAFATRNFNLIFEDTSRASRSDPRADPE